MVFDPLAQLVEHNTFNVGVMGSSPMRITKKDANRNKSLIIYGYQGFLFYPTLLFSAKYSNYHKPIWWNKIPAEKSTEYDSFSLINSILDCYKENAVLLN